MINLIAWIVVGAFAGWVASRIMHTDAEMGALENIVAGIIGALVGGWIMRNFLNTSVDPNGFNILSIATAIVGAVIVIAIYKAITGRRIR